MLTAGALLPHEDSQCDETVPRGDRLAGSSYRVHHLERVE